MRLFVAAELDEIVRARAAAVTARLRAAADSDGRGAVSWVAPANLHFTLRFIGEVDAGVAARVAARLAPGFELPAFEVSVGGVGTFPTSGPPRVVWLGVSEGDGGLAALAGAVNDRFDSIGLPREQRSFRAHLTIGRVKGPAGPRFREALAAARDSVVGRCAIDRVTLFESRLSPRGSTYSVVATSRLG
jgi:RNA 2',3'-cyclic 3'-phosphodiesterase